MSDAAALREALTGSTTESLAVRREVLPFALAALARLKADLARVTEEAARFYGMYESACDAANQLRLRAEAAEARIREVEAERDEANESRDRWKVGYEAKEARVRLLAEALREISEHNPPHGKLVPSYYVLRRIARAALAGSMTGDAPIAEHYTGYDGSTCWCGVEHKCPRKMSS